MTRLLLLFSLMVLGCNASDQRNTEKWFFDLNAFADKERIRLGDGVSVDKKITLDGVHEAQHFDDYTWTAELAMLSEWDINRPAWKDFYTADTTLSGYSSLYVYQSTKEHLQVQKLVIRTTQGEVDSIFINTRVKNPLHTTTAEFEYRPGKGMVFTQVSRRRLGQNEDLKVEVQQIANAD